MAVGAPPATVGIDLSGTVVNPVADTAAAAVVLVFVGPECPTANRYAPEIARLAREWTPRGVRFWLVYPDAALTVDAIRTHVATHELTLSPLRDPRHALV